MSNARNFSASSDFGQDANGRTDTLWAAALKLNKKVEQEVIRFIIPSNIRRSEIQMVIPSELVFRAWETIPNRRDKRGQESGLR